MANKVILTPNLVHKIAGLSNLPLTVDEEKALTPQLSSILDYVNQLSKIPTEKVKPTFNVTSLKNIMREDKTSGETTLNQEEALANAPSVQNGLFKQKTISNKAI